MLLLVLALAVLSGCVINKRLRYDTPEIPMSAQFSNARGSDGASWSPNPEEAALAFWWRLFDNEVLNRLVDRAIANDPDLRIASQRVLQALARASQAEGGRLPEVSAPLRYEYEAPDGGVGSRDRGEEMDSSETYQVGLRGDWRVDLWGELKSLAEAADYDLWRAVFNYDERMRQLTSNVVRTYIDYLTLNDRLRIATETEKVLDNMLDGMLARLESGDATRIDVEQQRTAVKGVQADMPAIALERVRVKNRLVSLLGGLPGSVSLPDYGLKMLARPGVKPGVPSVLLLQRPDVRAIEAGLLAADANINVARARVLPPLDLTGEFGFGSQFIEEVFMPHTLFMRFVANLSATVFDAGRRKRDIDYSRAVHEELLETYVRVIYAASIEVEGALSSIEQTQQRLSLQQEATDAAYRAWSNSQDAYLGGVIDYLTWLDTARTYHRYLDDLYRFSGDNLRGYVDLFSALGGGAPLRAPLPGDGDRPRLELASMLTGDLPSLTIAKRWPPSDGWSRQEPAKKPSGKGSEHARGWLVSLTGIHSREGAEATWRDLQTRFPSQVKGHALLALNPIPTLPPEAEAATWYRLAVAGFREEQQAENWCLTLRQSQTRCTVDAYDDDAMSVGRFPWPDPKYSSAHAGNS
ncbi:MAG: TolC family protein [Lamprobacter sp.]|nr:TolC family protein [Lamprobacter sp.]